MEFTSIVRRVNRTILDAQEGALVWAFARVTDNVEVEYLIRYEMDAVREFAQRHPWQMWNPCFIFNSDLGNELMGDIAHNHQEFRKVAMERRAQESLLNVPVLDVTDVKPLDVLHDEVDMDATLELRKKVREATGEEEPYLTINDVTALQRRIRAYSKKRGLLGEDDLTQAIAEMPVQDILRLGFER